MTRPRMLAFHTSPLDAYTPAVTRNTERKLPVVSTMYPVSKLAAISPPRPACW